MSAHSKGEILSLPPRAVVDGSLHLLVYIVHHDASHTETQPHTAYGLVLLLQGRPEEERRGEGEGGREGEGEGGLGREGGREGEGEGGREGGRGREG